MAGGEDNLVPPSSGGVMRGPRGRRRQQGPLLRWWSDGPAGRPGARRRYVTILLVFALIAGLPAIIAALPVSVGPASAATLLARIQASGGIPYTGLASSSGQLELPDLGIDAAVTDLLTSTSRVQVWWSTPTRYRVDQQSFDGEIDTYRNGARTWTWDSSTRVALRKTGPPEFPLPSAVDVLPGTAARRLLAEAKADQVTVGGSERIARHATRVLLWRPNDPRSLIAQVKVWADPQTGFPYGVEIRTVGGAARAFSSSFLEVSLDAPDPGRLRFDPRKDPTAIIPPPDNQVERGFPYARLRKTIGGLQQRSPLQALFGSYGDGASVVAVAAFPAETVRGLRSSIDSPGRPPIKGDFGEGSLISTSLVTGLLFTHEGRGYVLLGTVTRAQLEKMAVDLEEHPPDLSEITG